MKPLSSGQVPHFICGAAVLVYTLMCVYLMNAFSYTQTNGINWKIHFPILRSHFSAKNVCTAPKTPTHPHIWIGVLLVN